MDQNTAALTSNTIAATTARKKDRSFYVYSSTIWHYTAYPTFFFRYNSLNCFTNSIYSLGLSRNWLKMEFSRMGVAASRQ